jgi:hypothetical protein
MKAPTRAKRRKLNLDFTVLAQQWCLLAFQVCEEATKKLCVRPFWQSKTQIKVYIKRDLLTAALHLRSRHGSSWAPEGKFVHLPFDLNHVSIQNSGTT